MMRAAPRAEPVDPTEVQAASLAERGLAWPLARCLAPWLEAVEAAHAGDAAALLRAVGSCAVMLGDWIAEDEASARGLHAAARASLDLVEAVAGGDDLHLERRREMAWGALRALAGHLRGARPSPCALARGLGW